MLTEVRPTPDTNCGTIVKIWWPDSASSILHDARDRILQLADDYLFLNPHLTLTVNAFGELVRTEATNPVWKKWRPCDPSSAHWYDSDRFERLIAACAAENEAILWSLDKDFEPLFKNGSIRAFEP